MKTVSAALVAATIVLGGSTLRAADELAVKKVQGGLPITVDGKVVGAIGVSGNTPQGDGDIAKAGAALFK